MKKMLAWAERKVSSPHALPIFSLLVFIEAFFFMPVNTLMILYGIARPKDSFTLAALATLSSIIGAAVVYGLGLLLWNVGFQHLLYWFISPEKFTQCATAYKAHEIGSVFLISLLPVPFKLVTWTAGICKIPFVPYILSVAVARALRFFALAIALYFFGDKIQHFIDRYLYAIVMVIVVLLLGFIWFLYR